MNTSIYRKVLVFASLSLLRGRTAGVADDDLLLRYFLVDGKELFSLRTECITIYKRKFSYSPKDFALNKLSNCFILDKIKYTF